MNHQDFHSPRNENLGDSFSFVSYGYKCRNITSEKRGTLTTTYAYDSLGQLVRVNDPLEYATWVYEYDRGGNITSKKKYAYTTGTLGTVQQTIPYVYGDPTWKDKLTSYNGQTITYDAIGNPLSDGTWTYTWQAGRQLKKMSKSGMTVEFKYDHNGLRTQKKVTQNGVTTTTNYALHGKLVTHMTVGSDKLHFFYDAQSRPAKVNFNGTVYTYLHNLQGDIVGIVDGNGTLVVEYKYDAWGKLLSTTGTKATTLGKLNPFRYRGYVYDEESGVYYLRSRYYNPAWGRIISSDTLLGVVGALGSHNPFTYCNNSPSVYTDPDGNYAKEWYDEICVVGAISVAATGAAIRNRKSRSSSSASLSLSEAKADVSFRDFALIAVAALITAGERRRMTKALQTASITNARDIKKEENRNNYYFAYLPNVGGGNSLFVVNHPLTKEQAKTVLEYESVLNAVLSSHSISAGTYGIYTPTYDGAYALATEVGGKPSDENHGNSRKSGDFYNHFHGPRHGYHIWYGDPI